MKSFRSHAPHSSGQPSPLRRGVTWMMANSLVVYLAASQLQRVWTLLNSDVTQLVRRA